jgi:hypothetical protein
MKKIYSSCLLALCTALAACNADNAADPAPVQAKLPAATSSASPMPSSHALASSSISAQGMRAMSPLQSLLNVFAAQEAAPWPAFDGVSGVQWRDPKPLENSDSTGPDTTHNRSGNLLLSGFGVVDVPDGKMGAEAGTKKDNEGNVGVTLNGNADTVQLIVLQKFYPSDNTQDIIQRQLTTDATVKPIADQCALDYGTTATNTQKNVFYQINFGTPTPIYAETYVDADGGNQGPGTTTFVFYRSKPTQRIAAMRCKEH